jgi:hypothetical protein
MVREAFNSFCTKDLPTLERALKTPTSLTASQMYSIGVGCLIIERERLFITARIDRGL